ncbi:hypothetical protein TIFTF001_017812 [Ficus carica]|uniref:Uncharacterized protein n=1 Tax=Ficus carica TaxID=3494 RepID=A0AA88ACZ0_FICCA|nr:hypothetical protein TIFTF001_017812 [Ficus carica]
MPAFTVAEFSHPASLPSSSSTPVPNTDLGAPRPPCVFPVDPGPLSPNYEAPMQPRRQIWDAPPLPPSLSPFRRRHPPCPFLSRLPFLPLSFFAVAPPSPLSSSLPPSPLRRHTPPLRHRTPPHRSLRI